MVHVLRVGKVGRGNRIAMDIVSGGPRSRMAGLLSRRLIEMKAYGHVRERACGKGNRIGDKLRARRHIHATRAGKSESFVRGWIDGRRSVRERTRNVARSKMQGLGPKCIRHMHPQHCAARG